MELNVLEHDKSRFKFELQGMGHTFCNALRKELWQEASIEIAGYRIAHTLISEPVFTIETSKGDPLKVLHHALERIQKRNKELKELFKKI